jgi:AcrR family transcriptional regulator
MTKAERKQREMELRRNDIVDAAEKLFFARGYEAVNMNDIAQEAEMARGTLYQYFKNKEDIYVSIALRAANMINERFQKLLSQDLTGIDKVRWVCKFYYDFYLEYPGYYEAYYHSQMFEIDDSDTLKKLQKTRKTSFKWAVNSIKEGIKDGTLRDDIDPVVTALYLLSTSNNINNISPVTQMYLDEYGLTHDDLFNQTLDISIRSIENTNTSKPM